MFIKEILIIVFPDAVSLIVSLISYWQLHPAVAQARHFLFFCPPATFSPLAINSSFKIHPELSTNHHLYHLYVPWFRTLSFLALITARLSMAFLIPPFSPQSLFSTHPINMCVTLCHTLPQEPSLTFHFFQSKCEIPIMVLCVDEIYWDSFVAGSTPLHCFWVFQSQSFVNSVLFAGNGFPPDTGRAYYLVSPTQVPYSQLQALPQLSQLPLVVFFFFKYIITSYRTMQ